MTVVLRELSKGYDEDPEQIVNSTNVLTVEAVETDLAGGL